MFSSKCDKIFVKTLIPQNDYCNTGIEEIYSNKYTDHFYGSFLISICYIDSLEYKVFLDQSSKNLSCF